MKRQRSLQLVVLAAALTCLAAIAWLLNDGSSSPPPSPAPPAPAPQIELVISGRVVDSGGAAIVGARVDCGAQRAVSDGHGLFRCAGLAAGRHPVDASAPGYVRPGVGRSGAVQVAASPPTEAPITVLTLRRPGRLQGHVVAGSKPVAEAAVDVFYRTAAGLRGSVGPFRLAGAATTDAHGRFDATGLAPGRIELRARLGGDVSVLSRVIDLREGETVDGLLLRLQPGGTLSGIVRSRDGVAIAGRVEVRPSAEGEGFAADCDMNGSFAIGGIPPGTWQVEVSAPGFRRLQGQELVIVARAALSRTFVLTAIKGAVGQVVDVEDKPVTAATVLLRVGGQMQRVSVDGQGRFSWHRPGLPLFGGTALAISPSHAPSEEQPIEQGGELTLRLGPGGHVEGRVQDADGGIAASALVHLIDRKVDGPDPWGPPRPAPSHVQPDGSFRMGPLRPGRYDLRASKPGHPPGIARGVVVPAGGVGRVTIRLDAGALLHGRVAATDGAPLADATIALIPNDSDGRERSARSDAEGNWRIDTVPPGKWTLRAQHASHLPELVPTLEVPDRGELRHDISLRSPEVARSVRITRFGIELSEGVGGIMVTEAAGSGAAAGLRVGDRLTSVDFLATDHIALQELNATLSAETADLLSVEVHRPGQGPRTIYLSSGSSSP